jgi:hypothetical protein
VDTKNLESSIFIRNTNIDFTIKTTGTTKGWIDSVWSVSCTDNYNLATALDTVHQSKKLGDDTLFDFSL